MVGQSEWPFHTFLSFCVHHHSIDLLLLPRWPTNPHIFFYRNKFLYAISLVFFSCRSQIPFFMTTSCEQFSRTWIKITATKTRDRARTHFKRRHIVLRKKKKKKKTQSDLNRTEHVLLLQLVHYHTYTSKLNQQIRSQYRKDSTTISHRLQHLLINSRLSQISAIQSAWKAKHKNNRRVYDAPPMSTRSTKKALKRS